jgi:hypothetical protein
MVFGLLHKPYELDSMNLSLQDIDELDEDLATALWDRLQKAREKTMDLLRARARSRRGRSGL